MYIFFSDAAHGWLRVELAELKALNLLGKISGYSYINGRFAYLEEDCDASVFLKAKSLDFNAVSIQKKPSVNHSTIRHFARYSKELAEKILA